MYGVTEAAVYQTYATLSHLPPDPDGTPYYLRGRAAAAGGGGAVAPAGAPFRGVELALAPPSARAAEGGEDGLGSDDRRELLIGGDLEPSRNLRGTF